MRSPTVTRCASSQSSSSRVVPAPGGQGDQGMALQQGPGAHPARAGQVWCGRPGEVGSAYRLRQQAAAGRAPGDHGKVQLAIVQAALQHAAHIHHGLQREAGVGVPGGGHKGGQPGERREIAHTKTAPAGERCARVHCLAQRCHGLEHIKRCGQQALARFGEHGTVAAAVEQRLAQRRLQLGDALGQRRHRQVHALGRRGEIGAGGGPPEGFELLDRGLGHGVLVSEKRTYSF